MSERRSDPWFIFYFFKTLRPSTFLVARAKEGRQLVPGLVGRAGHLFLTLSKCAV